MNKYNDWYHKKPLVSNFKSEKYFEVTAKINQYKISSFSKSALLQKELLDIGGIEFIAFSNLKIDKNIKLNNGLELRPCFSPDLGGRHIDDPIQKAEYLMHKRGRYLYDGWLPIKNWGNNKIADELRKIDEFISLFSLTGHNYFSWFPKYFYKEKEIEIIYADATKNKISIIDNVLDLQNNLDNFKTKDDKKAIFRSINWINKAKETTDTVVKFLFYTLAIEQLAKYVENSKSTSSFYKIRTHKDKSERKKWKTECLKKTLEAIDYNNNPWVIVDKAYFDCNSGLKEMIKRQIKRAFKPNSYLHEINIDDIYSIRSKIAHGDIDTINVEEINFVNSKIHDINILAINYVLSILYKCDIEFEGGKLHASFGSLLDDAFISNASMYKGPTHMALVYYNMI
jgi:hypothetical protein